MSDVDNKVVSLTFDSSNFEKGVSVTLEGLARLEQGLEFDTAKSGLAGLEGEINNVDFSGMESAIASIDSKFSALGAAAFTAIQSVSNSAIDVAKDMYNNTLGQILTGGRSRSIAIEQARFQFRGLGLDVEATMQSALDAVTGTAYGLDEAATLAGVFGAAGITAGDQMTGALRGVAGVATITTSAFGDIGQVFQNISAIGRLTTNDMQSLALRGLGFQKQADALGISVDELRRRATDGSIGFEEFAGAMDRAFGEHATEANKTYTGALANLRAALSRFGATFITPQLEAQRNVFNALSPAIDKVKDAFGPLIDAWKLFVNIQAIKTINFLDNINFGVLRRLVPDVVRILKNLYTAIGTFLKPIKEAFKEIFPPITGRNLENIALAIKRFTRNLALSKETADKVKRIFAGLFSVFSIGFAIVKGLAGVIMDIVKALLPAGDGMLSFGAGVGDTLVSLKKFLVDGKGIGQFFDTVSDKVVDFINAIKDSNAIRAFGDAISWVGDAIANLFGGGGSDDAGVGLGRLGQRFDDVADSGKSFVDLLVAGFNLLADVAGAVIGFLTDTFGGLGSAIAGAIKTGDFNKVLDVINVGLLGGIATILYKLLRGGFKLDLTGGALDKIKSAFEQLDGVMQDLQTNLKAGTLRKIAEAILILTISIVALSLIDSGALTKALLAISAGMGELVAAMALLSRIDISDSGKIIALGTALVLIAGSLTLFAIAVGLMSLIPMDKLTRGMAGISGGLVELTLAATAIGGADGGRRMIAGGIAMGVMAIALGVLSVAVWAFSKLDWGELARGFTGITGGLVGLTVAVNKLPSDPKSGLSLFLISLSLSAVAKAVKKMADLSWDEIKKGLIGLGGALLGIAAVSHLMSTNIAGAAGFLIVTFALGALADLVERFGNIPAGELIKGILGLAAAILVVGGLGVLMGIVAPELILGGLAMIPLAFGLRLLGSAVKKFGNLSWAELGMGLLAIAASMLVVALASVLLSPAVLPMLAFGAALTLLGLGMLAFGGGVALFAGGLALLAKVGPDAAESMVGVLITIAGAIPEILSAVAEGFLAFFQVIVDAAPALVEGIITILTTLLEGIVTLAPQIADAFVAVMTAITDMIVAQAPILVEAGVSIITALLQGLQEALPTLIPLVGEIITTFLNGLTAQMGRIVSAGLNLLVSFIDGIARGASQLSAAGIRLITSVLNGISNNVDLLVTAGTTIIVNFINGISSSLSKIVTAGVNLVVKFLEGIRQASKRIVTAAFELVIGLIEDLTTAINENSGRLGEAAGELGRAIISGIGNAIRAGAPDLKGILFDAVGSLVDGAKGLLGISSPSRVFMEIGSNVIKGMVMGIDDHASAINSAETLGDDVVNTMRSISQRMNDELAGMDEMNPTISPVLDLDRVRQAAGGLGGILGSDPLDAKLSYDQAQRISNDAATREQEMVSSSGGTKEIKFEQNIHSPRELSAGEIYRNTRSQIALAKTDLEDI